MKNNLKILVCCHKDDPNICSTDPYTPIQVGKELHPDLDLGFICDNEGQNISAKNPEWCELTALYWGWKNLHDFDYIGLSHYRRYLDIDINCISKVLNDYDIIVGDATNTPHPIAHGLIRAMSRDDFYIYLDTIVSMRPDAKEAVYHYFFETNKFIPFTMFIASKELFYEYCEFIFPILFEVEKRIKPHSYTRQKRCLAYFGEWSLGLFITYRHLNVKRVPIVQNILKKEKKNLIRNTIISCRSGVYNLKMNLYFRFLKKYYLSIYRNVPEDVRVGYKQDNIELKCI